MNESPRVLGNRYEVGDLLGRGGMAEVHLGRDTRLGRVVAIKLLRTDLARDPMFQARFRREAQSAAGLNHPSIVAVYDTGEETIIESGGGSVSLPYIVMEYVEGRTLRDILREGDPMEVQQALEVTGGVLSALDYSHRMGIVHRDIKPANVMLTAHGDVKVMDFGIARALADVSATMTQTQAVIGTAQYLSPEQARGETVDARSDLYSAGCLLFELMTGRPPFVADSPVAVAYQHVREAPSPPSAFNPRIPETIDRIVLHALAKDREARYQTAAEFRADLESALAGRAVATATAAMAAPAARGGQAATEYLPQAPGATQAYQQTSAYPPAPPGYPPPGPGGPPGPGQGGYDPYGRRPDGGYDQPEQGYGEEGAFTRRGDRRAAAATSENSRRLGFVVLALLVLAVFASAAYGVSYMVTNSAGTQVKVPPVKGYSQADAADRLTKAGLNVKLQQEANDQFRAGQAVRAQPTGSVSPGTQIILFISTGAARAVVPDVHGKSQSDAIAALKAAGLQPNTDLVQPVEGKGLAKGLVVGTAPPAGKDVARNTSVTLEVSNGKAEVPDEVGKDVKDAQSDLQKQGFEVKVEIVFTDEQTAGQVLEQSPKAGMSTSKSVTLTVAQPTSADPNNQNNGQPSSSDPNGQNNGGQNGQNNGGPNGGQNTGGGQNPGDPNGGQNGGQNNGGQNNGNG